MAPSRNETLCSNAFDSSHFSKISFSIAGKFSPENSLYLALIKLLSSLILKGAKVVNKAMRKWVSLDRKGFLYVLKTVENDRWVNITIKKHSFDRNFGHIPCVNELSA